MGWLSATKARFTHCHLLETTSRTPADNRQKTGRTPSVKLKEKTPGNKKPPLELIISGQSHRKCTKVGSHRLDGNRTTPVGSHSSGGKRGNDHAYDYPGQVPSREKD